MKDKKKTKRGAPVKREDQKILSNHFRGDQWKWVKGEAVVRGIPAWEFVRLYTDWAKDAFDRKRGDVSASALFDDVLNEEVGGKTKSAPSKL